MNMKLKFPVIFSLLFCILQLPVYAEQKKSETSVSGDTRRATPSEVGPTRSASDARSFDKLVEALNNPDASVRKAAVESLGKLGDARAAEPILGALKDVKTSVRSAAFDSIERLAVTLKERQDVKTLCTILQYPDFSVRLTVVEMLTDIPTPGSAEALIPLLGDSDDRIRTKAREALKKIGNPSVDPLIAQLKSDNADVRIISVMQLGEMKDGRAVEPLIEALNASTGQTSDDEKFRIEAVNALGEMRDARATESLIAALKNPSSALRDRAVMALKKMGPQAVQPLIKTLKEGDADVQVSVAMILGDLGDPSSVEPLIDTMLLDVHDNRSWLFRVEAAKALGKIKDPRALDPLGLLIEDRVSQVRDMAKWAIDQMNGVQYREKKEESGGWWKKIID